MYLSFTLTLFLFSEWTINLANGFLALMELNGFSGLINIPILDIKNRHLQLINHSHFEAAFKNIYIYIYFGLQDSQCMEEKNIGEG